MSESRKVRLAKCGGVHFTVKRNWKINFFVISDISQLIPHNMALCNLSQQKLLVGNFYLRLINQRPDLKQIVP